MATGATIFWLHTGAMHWGDELTPAEQKVRRQFGWIDSRHSNDYVKASAEMRCRGRLRFHS
jgi:hypothetical protein